MDAKKVFISYAWDNEDIAEKVLNLANTLRSHGIDATIDQYEENPDQGWAIWMEKQIESSEYVLVVATKTYYEKFEQQIEGKGVSWEVSSIYQSLYNLRGHNNKFIPIVFDDNDLQYILKALQPFTHYNVIKNLLKLENRINGIANTIKPPVNIKPMPTKKRKSIFISSPINLELWDNAKWQGTAFIYLPDGGWLMGLVFDGDAKSAIQIFDEWSKLSNLDDYMNITFIEGDIENLPPNGYTCLISPNINKAAERANKIDEKNDIIIAVNRFQRMYPKDHFYWYNEFKKVVLANKSKKLVMVPLTIKDITKKEIYEKYNINIDKGVGISNIIYKNSVDIKKGDAESCVIPNFNKNFPANEE